MLFKVTFHLDGSGLYYDRFEPIHLDALLTWCMAPRVKVAHDIGRGDNPEHVPIPLLRKTVGAHWVWCASALFPDGPQGEDLQFWRKRFRQSRADLSIGSPNLQNGTYREWNTPLPMTLTLRMVAYANGNRKECKRLLRELTHLGKKRAHGHGKIISIDFDESDQDWSICRDGLAMRWLPYPEGNREVRVRPPYWNIVDRVRCCEVGDPWSIKKFENILQTA